MLHITPWERAVLQLLADGATTTDIAARFDMSDGDIEAHLSALFARMGVRNRDEASLDASRRGLLSTSSLTEEIWAEDRHEQVMAGSFATLVRDAAGRS